MTRTSIKKLAKEHAISVLGEKEFKSNPNARTSIMTDFIAGFKACRQELTKEVIESKKYRKLEDDIMEAVVIYHGEEHNDYVIVGQLVLKHFGI